jgi:hypothetical protein
MQISRFPLLLAIVTALLGTTRATGNTLCKPTLEFREVRFSEVRGQQRIWTAVLAADASHCATTSGRFNLNFVRLKEMAPDLLFTEQFTWRPGLFEVSVDFWLDEALLDYSTGYISACPCRN